MLLCASAMFACGPRPDAGKRALAERRHGDASPDAQRCEGTGAEVLLDLGNAYAGSGDVGRAVLSYERALLLAPRSDAVRRALRELRRDVGLEGEPDRGWRDYYRYLTTSEWAVTGLCAGVILLLAFTRGRRLPWRIRVRLVMVGFLLALPAAAAIAKHALDRDRAVIVAPGDLLASPRAAAEAIDKARPGQVVRIVRVSADFALVRGAGGRSGWIALASVEPVTP